MTSPSDAEGIILHLKAVVTDERDELHGDGRLADLLVGPEARVHDLEAEDVLHDVVGVAGEIEALVVPLRVEVVGLRGRLRLALDLAVGGLECDPDEGVALADIVHVSQAHALDDLTLHRGHRWRTAAGRVALGTGPE
eukprot:CAMPEP_0179286916 /NCGR_PEP_ID=MMETSP0797-20121207/39995_1 /TAXON_ID=47934 /ORGANISM="Dinophysis acuminata, Strain DAEP01" /LENGTH=137 /DNA_ID=CAMNT_0020995829 /DNA_START=58 /DNA_END=469 /DNA_ORIENTATION=-